MNRVLLVDNYDSFTYNLDQALRILGASVRVARNDEITLQEAIDFEPTHLVISPGPGRPEKAGVSMDFLRHFIGKLPILGVCLGHQALGAVLGGTVTHAPRLMHGKSSPVYHDGKGVFAGLSNPFDAARYHSLIVQRSDLPAQLEVSAYTAEGEIMGIRHRELPVVGVQFHPESVLTGQGPDLLANFLEDRLMLEQLLNGHDLTQAQGQALLRTLTDPAVPDALKGGLLAALRAKGETAEELRGMALAMRDAALPLPIDVEGPLVDTCGTGGDGSHSINISTATSLVVAALGFKVVKHGNRSVSSKSGSADVLEALGVTLPADPNAAAQRLVEHGWTFLFAPVFHPAMKAVVPVRRAMAVRTAFNLLGPLTNPARPGYQLLGAFSPAAARKMAHALSGLGVKRAFVVHGEPHWDEATPMGAFLRLDVREGSVVEERIDPLDYGIPRCEVADLAGGDAAFNASVIRRIFDGEKGAGRDAITLNAALVLELLGLSRIDGVRSVRQALDDGTVAGFIDRLSA